MSAVFMKLLSGKWGVRVFDPIKPGEQVWVKRKDGSMIHVTVRHILKRDTKDGSTICSVSETAEVHPVHPGV